jgi:O-antigen ligase/tetratricopeptide (TPR) repeat protein
MKLNNILRYIVIVGLFLLPIIPYYVSKSMFFPFITGKNFAFRVIIEVVFASWIMLAFRDIRYRPRKSGLAISIALFLGIIALADLFGVNFIKSVWSNFERMEGLMGLLHTTAFFFVAGTVLCVDNLWKRFFHWSFIIATVLAIYGILQIVGVLDINQGSGVRVDSTLGNATYLGVYAMIHIFLAFFYLFRHKGSSIIRYLYIAFILLQFTLLYYSATRGAILGLLFGACLALALIIWRERRNAKVKKGAVFVAIGLLTIIGGFYLLRNSGVVKNSEVLSRFSSISLNEGRSRFMVWNMAWQGFLERPILGWGQENFDVVFNKYYNPQMYTQEAWFDRAHNIVFDWLIAGGLLGFLSYLSIITMALYLIWKDKRGVLSPIDKSILTGFFVAYFFQNLFVFDNITSYFLYFSVLGMIHGLEASPSTKHKKSSVWNKMGALGNFERITAPVVVIVLIGSLYLVNVRPIAAGQYLIQSISRQEGGPSENIARFERALSLATIGKIEVREQLMQFALQLAETDGVDNDLKEKTVSWAESEMRKQVEEAPLSARNYFFLGTFLRRIGRAKEATEVLENAVKLSEKKQIILFELGLAYLTLGDHENSLSAFKRAFDAEPKYEQARLFYAVVAIYANKFDLVDTLFIPVYGDTTPTNDYVLRAYYDVARHDRVLEIWRKRVDADPENGEFRLSFGAAFLALGDKASAIREVQKASELDPGLKERADNILQDIK